VGGGERLDTDCGFRTIPSDPALEVRARRGDLTPAVVVLRIQRLPREAGCEDDPEKWDEDHDTDSLEEEVRVIEEGGAHQRPPERREKSWR
jgi:hypothetical protein